MDYDFVVYKYIRAYGNENLCLLRSLKIIINNLIKQNKIPDSHAFILDDILNILNLEVTGDEHIVTDQIKKILYDSFELKLLITNGYGIISNSELTYNDYSTIYILYSGAHFDAIVSFIGPDGIEHYVNGFNSNTENIHINRQCLRFIENFPDAVRNSNEYSKCITHDCYFYALNRQTCLKCQQ
jgi:hypothetical protein